MGSGYTGYAYVPKLTIWARSEQELDDKLEEVQSTFEEALGHLANVELVKEED